MVNIEAIKKDDITDIMQRVQNNSQTIEEIVNLIIEPYCKDMDLCVNMISSMLEDNGSSGISDPILDETCVKLSTYIYFASDKCEQLGIREDISKEIYKETFNNGRKNGSGTVADKNGYAEEVSAKEHLVNICYSRAYKIMKNKLDYAQEVLLSCKKIISRRIQEMKTTGTGYGV